MRPPVWALENSTRLDLTRFATEFAGAWSKMGSRFLKVECWQTYREAEGNTSQEAYDRGDVEKARELLNHEAEADRPLYDDVEKRGIDYARIRLVQEPLTPYLEYELTSYRIREEMGENIEIVRRPPHERLPDEDHFDFLLFDRSRALIHDYGDTGSQSGGWGTSEPAVILRLEECALRLRRAATPLRQFLVDTQR
jgi:hypothetical protein